VFIVELTVIVLTMLQGRSDGISAG